MHCNALPPQLDVVDLAAVGVDHEGLSVVLASSGLQQACDVRGRSAVDSDHRHFRMRSGHLDDVSERLAMSSPQRVLNADEGIRMEDGSYLAGDHDPGTNRMRERVENLQSALHLDP